MANNSIGVAGVAPTARLISQRISAVNDMGEEIFATTVGGGESAGMKFLFRDFEVPLSRWAGQKVRIELVDAPNGWSWEAAYWSRLEVAGFNKE